MLNSKYKIKDIITFIKKELNQIYSNDEIQSLVIIIFQHVLNYSKIDIHLNIQTKLTDSNVFQIKKIVSQLKSHMPIQYITGKTEFFEIPFDVSPDVLIPRPETEELVQWIIDETNIKNPKILDIGTGCGCIAVALSKNLANSKVDAIDNSEKALFIASENARKNHIKINFSRLDILNYHSGNNQKKYDIIVSNPPYVKEEEKKEMKKNVLKYEPHDALFVSDRKPLVFYEAITDFAFLHLNQNAKLYFEINESLSSEIASLLTNKSFKNIQIKKDINGKHRIIRGEI